MCCNISLVPLLLYPPLSPFPDRTDRRKRGRVGGGKYRFSAIGRKRLKNRARFNDKAPSDEVIMLELFVAPRGCFECLKGGLGST